MGISRFVETIGARVRRRTRLELKWLKRAGWIGANLVKSIPRASPKGTIEAAARRTNQLGAQELAREYGETAGTRHPNQVRSSSACGDLYAWLTRRRRAGVVVEFGSAFGVSGMYFASGLESGKHGHLYSFEINRNWAAIAEANIKSISSRFTLTRGAFEEQVEAVVPGKIDIAFVDGIHAYDLVMRQFELLQPRMDSGGLILLDDIDFPRPAARMHEAWKAIAADEQVIGAVEINRHVGLVEVQ